jgi:hypothetical protein
MIQQTLMFLCPHVCHGFIKLNFATKAETLTRQKPMRESHIHFPTSH